VQRLPLPAQPAGGYLFLIEPSKTAAKAICAAIAAARQQVCVCSFLLADPDIVAALKAKAETGVPVYLLVASEARLARAVSEDSDAAREQVDAHKELLGRLAGWVLVRTADHFHAKFVLVDPTGTSPQGFLSTANLTDEALKRNVELVLRLSPHDVQAIFRLFVWGFWEHAQRELTESGKGLVSVSPTGRFVVPVRQGAVVATAGSRHDLRDAILAIISEARQELFISSFSFGHPQVNEAVRERCKAGVKVTVLSRESRPAQEPLLRELAQAGATVLGVPWIHAKAICADGKRGIVMTANLAEDSLDEDGFEVGVVLDRIEAWQGANAQMLRSILMEWAANASWRYYHELALGDITGKLVLHGTPNKVESYSVTPRRTIPIDDVKLRCCTELESVTVPAAKALPRGERAHVVEYTYRILLPVLDPKATPLTEDELFPKPKKRSKNKKPGSESTPKPDAESEASKSIDAPEEAEMPRRSLPPFDLYREPSGRRVLVIDDVEQTAAAEPHMAAWQADAVVIRN
jgi:cardiolipin synthase